MDNVTRKLIAMIVISLVLGTLVFIASMHRSTGKAEARVVGAKWVPTPSGYALQVSIQVRKPVTIEYVRLDRKAVNYIARVNPPVSNLTLFLAAKKQYGKVTMDLSDGETLSFHPTEYRWSTTFDVDFYFSSDTLFIVGNLPETVNILAFPRELSEKVLVVVSDKSILQPERFKSVIGLLANVTVTSVRMLSNDTLMNYTHIAFVDVTPSPRLLSELVKTGHKIAYIGETAPFGSYRFDFFNGQVQTYLSDKGGIDYFGADCTVPVKERASQFSSPFIKKLYELYGASESSLAISDSPFCRKLFPRVYVVGDKGYILIASNNNTLIAYGPRLPAIVLFSLGVVDHPKLTLKEVSGGMIGPFFGVNPIGTSSDYRFIRILLFTDNSLNGFDAIRYPINATLENNTYLVSIPAVGFTQGFHRVTVYEYDLMYHLLGIPVNGSIYIPGSIRVPFNPEHVYVIAVDGRPASLIAYNPLWSPRITANIDYSGICELFTLRVKGKTNVPLKILLDGYPVYKTGIGDFSWTEKKCTPGKHEVILLLPNMVVAKKEVFQVKHLYTSPLFYASLAVLVTGVAGFYVSSRMKARVEIEAFKGVFYEIEEVKRTYIKKREVVDIVKKLQGRLNRAPTIQEFLSEAYRVTHSFEGVIQASKLLGDLIGKRILRFEWRYIPELGDHLGVVSTSKEDTAKHLYFVTLNRVAIKMGAILRNTSDLKKIIESDAILQTDVERKRYILVSFAPTEKDIRPAINAALKSFVQMRGNKLEIELVGLAIVTERKYVKAVNDILDAIFSGNYEVAEKVLIDVSILEEIATVPLDKWLENFLITAVPIDRVAPLVAFTALKACKLGNKYYRYTKW